MKTWQFFSLQGSIFIVASLAATDIWAKAGFLLLAIFYLIAQFAAYKSEA